MMCWRQTISAVHSRLQCVLGDRSTFANASKDLHSSRQPEEMSNGRHNCSEQSSVPAEPCTVVTRQTIAVVPNECFRSCATHWATTGFRTFGIEGSSCHSMTRLASP